LRRDTVPLSGFSVPTMMRMRLLLPEPLRPTRPQLLALTHGHGGVVEHTLETELEVQVLAEMTAGVVRAMRGGPVGRG